MMTAQGSKRAQAHPLMKLDLPTLAFILSLTCLTQVAALLVQYAVDRTLRWTGWWLVGSALLALGFILLSMGGLPAMAVPSRIANPLLVAGRICLYIGVLRFMGRRTRTWVLGALFLATLGCYYHFLFVHPSIAGRTLTISVAIGALSWMTAHALLARGETPRTGSTRFTATIFLGHGAFLFAMALYTLGSAPIQTFLEFAPIQVATFVVPIATSALSTFGFILMVNQRLVLEKAEERRNLQRIFNTSPDAAMITRKSDGLLVDVNHGFLAMFGHTRADVIERSTLVLGIWAHPEEREAFLQHLHASGSCENREHVFHRKGGDAFVGLVSAKLLRMNQVPHIISVVRDITSLKRAEQERMDLETRNRQLLKSESLGRMAGAIAHHFNNQLQSVMANLELMRELPRGSDLTPYMKGAKRATERAAEMSRLMLCYLGQTSLEQALCSLPDLCRRGLSRIQENLPDGVALATELPTSDLLVLANQAELQQVLSNLVTNAIEALEGREGKVRVRITLEEAATCPSNHLFPIDWTPRQGRYTCLEVEDSGCGIPSSEREKLFDPFFTTKFTGRGLGLSVVLGIVQAHGGAVAVESQTGQGSTFRVFLPLQPGSLPPSEDLGQQAMAPLAGGTVLLVDDDQALLEVTGALVEHLGFSLLTACDGIQALEVFRAHRDQICCVITDLTMPRMDGWETLSALRTLAPTLPVILASGYSQAQALSPSMIDRPQAFLGKPFSQQQLQEALSQALGRSVV